MTDTGKTSTGGGYNVDFSGRPIEAVNAERVELSQCSVQSIQAERVNMEKSAAAFVVAEKIEASNSATLIMLAKEVSGNIRPIVSLPGALIIAGALLLGFALFNRNK